MSRCRSCKAPIVWARTTKGRSVPLDAVDQGGWEAPAEFEAGNIESTGQRVPTGQGQTAMVVRYVAPDTPGRRYRAHFTTCPDAASWRRDRKERTTTS